MGLPSDENCDLVILEKIDQNPEATQASLAAQLGVAVGTINWHLKRLIAKGYIKVRRAERRKLLYMITAEGLALRARLTLDYINSSFHLYRLIRQRVADTLAQVHADGYSEVRLEGEGDIAEVCRLTCLEHGIMVVQSADAPRLTIHGLKVFLEFPEKKESAQENAG
jgi:DNA-binding MarR family transcriptional regulator